MQCQYFIVLQFIDPANRYCTSKPETDVPCRDVNMDTNNQVFFSVDIMNILRIEPSLKIGAWWCFAEGESQT